MSSLPSAPASVPVNPATAASGDIKQAEEPNQDVQMLNSANGEVPNVNWESELQLVHELRQFLPEGLLEPLVPEKPAANSPSQLRHDLEQAARARLSGIKDFQTLWQGTDMRPVWDHVESRIKESNGDFIQPTGMWEKDYDVLLKELLKADKTKEEEIEQEQEKLERSKAQSSDEEWQTVLEKFTQRDVPGIRVVKGQDPFSLSVVLAKAGMIFSVKGAQEPNVSGVSEWQVVSQTPASRSPSKLEQAIQDCLNSRPRKWDISFVLDMISSYADIKQTPCIKCKNLTNNAAQLPTMRRFKPILSQNEPRTFEFDALHQSCA